MQALRDRYTDATFTIVVPTKALLDQWILSLEEDNFEALPAAVFVRGFIRSYAREVDLDPTEVLGRYENLLHENEITCEPEDGTSLGPLLFMRSDVPDQPSHRGLQISHVLLLMLALATFIIAYMTAGIPGKDQEAPVHHDQASTEQPVPAAPASTP